MSRTIEEIQKDLDTVRDEIDAQYWTFTRCARGKPPDPALYEKRKALTDEMVAVKKESEEK